MPHVPKRKRPVAGTALTVLAILTLIGLVLWAERAPIQAALASITGEEDPWQQIKGLGAWLLLQLRPAPETAPMTPMAYTGLSPYGINTFLEQEVEEAKIERSLQLISKAGFHWIRQQFPWEDIEIYGKGDYWDHQWNHSAWEKYDRLVELAQKYDLEIIARLDNPPAWSRAVGNAEGWSLGPPDDFEDYGDFVYAVVSRYRGQIRYYQIWNEPNIYPEWGNQPVDPEAYVRLLQIAYRRAKEADPDCVIIAAGLAQTTELGPRNLSDLIYLERMYEAGVQGYFDVMGAMVYGLWTGPLDRRTSSDRTNFSRVQLTREIMVRHGDADKPLWATEVGWNALPVDFEGAAPYGRVTLEQQARYAVQAYQRAAREWPWMGVMNYWFFRRPSDAESDQPWYYFRMVEPDFTPLPVYDAMRELANQPPTVHMGYHQEDHWALSYQGDWQRIANEAATLGAYQRGEAGDELRFTFEGTGLDLVVLDTQQASAIEVYLDGRRVQRLTPAQAPSNGAPTLRIARYLRDRPHEVRLVIHEGELGLDGVVVWRQTRWSVGIPLILAALVGLGVALGLRASRARWALTSQSPLLHMDKGTPLPPSEHLAHKNMDSSAWAKREQA